MRPKSYCEYPRRCQNCKFIAMSMQTSFLAKKGSDTFHCIKYDPTPILPITDADIKGDLICISDSARSKYEQEFKIWQERTKVSSEGSCAEHEFTTRV